MKRLAIREVCRIAAPRLVLELTKNVRIGLRAESGLALRDGRAMAGRNYKLLPVHAIFFSFRECLRHKELIFYLPGRYD